MGYPIEKIGPDTQLFSLIGTNAIEHKQDAIFNDCFKQMDSDCKMMALNIRQDDIGFFLNGLKDSQIKGVYFEEEYWQSIATLLKDDNKEVHFCGICDTIDIEDATLKMRISIGRAIVELLGDITGKTVMIIGSTYIAKSILFNLIKQEPTKIILAEEVIEELMEMMVIIPKKIVTDIVRIQEHKIKEDYDISVNCTDMPIKSDIDVTLDNDKILTKIAEINTTTWSEKWTI